MSIFLSPQMSSLLYFIRAYSEDSVGTSIFSDQLFPYLSKYFSSFLFRIYRVKITSRLLSPAD
jgi:hypothetical protein